MITKMCIRKTIDTYRSLPEVRDSYPQGRLILWIIFFAITAFLVGEYPRFSLLPNYGLWNPYLFGIILVMLWCEGAILLVNARRFHLFGRREAVWLPFMCLLLCIIIGAVFTGQDSALLTDPDYLVAKPYFVVSEIHTIIALSMVIVLCPKFIQKRTGLYLMFLVLVAFSLTSAIYSLCTEWDDYVRILTTQHLSGWRAPTSWTLHKNVFGRYLLIGIFGEYYLHALDRRPHHYLLIAVLGFFLVMTMAKAPILIALVSFIAFEIYTGTLTLRRRRGIAIAHFAIVGAIGILIVLAFVLPSSALGAIGSMVDEIKSSINPEGAGTLMARYEIWVKCFDLLIRNPFRFLFGYGTNAFAIAISPAMDIPTVFGSAHNAWVEAMGRWGLFGLLSAGALVGMIVWRAIKRGNAKKSLLPLVLIVGTSILLLSLLESCFIFDLSIESMCFIVLLIFPLGWAAESKASNQAQRSTKIDYRKARSELAAFLTLCQGSIVMVAMSSSLLPVKILLTSAVFLSFPILFFLDQRRLLLASLPTSVLSVAIGGLFPLVGLLDRLGLASFALIVPLCIYEAARKNTSPCEGEKLCNNLLTIALLPGSPKTKD